MIMFTLQRDIYRIFATVVEDDDDDVSVTVRDEHNIFSHDR